jgi:hypothetical protein
MDDQWKLSKRFFQVSIFLYLTYITVSSTFIGFEFDNIAMICSQKNWPAGQNRGYPYELMRILKEYSC